MGSEPGTPRSLRVQNLLSIIVLAVWMMGICGVVGMRFERYITQNKYDNFQKVNSVIPTKINIEQAIVEFEASKAKRHRHKERFQKGN